LVRWLLRHSFRCLAFVLLKEIGTLAVHLEGQLFWIFEESLTFGLPKGAARSGSRDAAGKTGERSGKKTGGGGLINSGRRTFAPNVLGRDPRPPLGRQKVKQKVGDPRGGWVSQRPKKDQGQKKKSDIFSRVLFLPSPKNAQKRDKKKPRNNRFFCRILLKLFDTIIFVTRFLFVFLNSHRWEILETAFCFYQQIFFEQKKSRKN
jgi:hypothetical protein